MTTKGKKEASDPGLVVAEHNAGRHIQCYLADHDPIHIVRAVQVYAHCAEALPEFYIRALDLVAKALPKPPHRPAKTMRNVEAYLYVLWKENHGQILDAAGWESVRAHGRFPSVAAAKRVINDYRKKYSKPKSSEIDKAMRLLGKKR